IHKTGYGLPANLEKSYMWFNISAAAGIQEAIIARDKIMLSLTPKQLKKAQEASRKWFLNTNKDLIN
ncbi:MAG: sel1 repeat family protein, partial [Gammaproteobacteria bacterium]|nr:sel1 repeat family protein [Gammaproteobacteria bacterium]